MVIGPFIVLVSGLIGALLWLRLNSTRPMAIVLGQGLTLQEMRRMVDQELPPGSSRRQIQRWFKRKNISYNYLDGKKQNLNNDSDAAACGIPIKNLSGVLRANIFGYSGKIIKCRSHLVFFLDKKGNSVKHNVYGGCSNPIDRLPY